MRGLLVTRKHAKDDEERGGVTLTVAICMVVLMGIASFAIDLGMQRVGRRDMQALADMVALDMARLLDGRTKTELLADPAWEDTRRDAVARNGDTFGDAPVVTALPGRLDPVTRTVDTASPEVPDAVVVTATGSVDYVLREGEGGISRTAVAQSAKTACFALGSYAARFRSADAALLSSLVPRMNAFLRPQANLDALSYRGIANATVSLSELAADSNVGTVNDLLTGTVTVDRVLRATIAALQRQNPVNTVAVDAALKVLNGHASLSNSISLTDVAAISPTDDAAAEVRLNVLDLITGAILLADGEHAVNVPNLSAGTGNLSPVSASLKVIERSRTACGDDVARTAQLKGDILMKLQLPSINGITGVQGVVQTPEASVRLLVDLGTGVGQVGASGPTCGDGTATNPDTIPVDVASQLATLKMSTILRFQAAKLYVLGLGYVDVTFDHAAVSEVPMPPTNQSVVLQVPPNDTTPISVGSSAPLGNFTIAGSATNVSATMTVAGVTVPVLGADLDLVRSSLVNVSSQLVVHPSVVDPLNHLVGSANNLLTPLRTLLGLQVSGVDVFAVGRPTCNGSSLRG